MGDRLELAETSDGLSPGYRGIPQPTGPAVLPSGVDVILVPGLGFSHDGRRIGQGGGYYDRLLPLVRGLKIGVAFSCQMADQIPIEPHDHLVDGVITEHGPVWCR